MNQPHKRKPGHYLEDLTSQACDDVHDRDSVEVLGVVYRFHHITFGESLLNYPSRNLSWTSMI